MHFDPGLAVTPLSDPLGSLYGTGVLTHRGDYSLTGIEYNLLEESSSHSLVKSNMDA